MVSIVDAQLARDHRIQFRDWVEAEWDDVDSFESFRDGCFLPPTLLAIDVNNLLGGLAFTTAPIPGGDVTGIWINVLLVSPEYRGAGIGSKLISAAESEARRLNVKVIFVYTELPDLYMKLGWLLVDDSGESAVLKKVLS